MYTPSVLINLQPPKFLLRFAINKCFSALHRGPSTSDPEQVSRAKFLAASATSTQICNEPGLLRPAQVNFIFTHTVNQPPF